MTHDPIRLLDDPSAHAALRRDLVAAARHRAPYDAAAGAARFEASLAQGTGAASTGWSAGALGLGALILGGLITAGVWFSSTPEAPGPEPVGARGPIAAASIEAPAPVVAPSEPVTPAPVVAPVQPAVAAPVVEAVPEDRAEETDAPVAPRSAKPARARVGAGAKKKDPAPASEADAAADYLREARSLQAARALLGRDAAQALTRAQAGAAEFPRGAFGQEWQGVEILALFELGRRAEAEPRATRFLDQYPHGPYASQVREALQRP